MATGLRGEDRGSPARPRANSAAGGALPNLIVIGAQKCGTSSLHSYLNAHPEIAMSAPKELNFFGGPGFANWDRGVDWYRAQFDSEAPVRGESSPSYTAYPFVVGTPERIHALVPDAKLVYMVRDPIERLLSQWVHLVASGRERRSLDEIFAGRPPEHTAYVLQSSYWLQIEQYLEFFPRDRLLVIDQADLRSDRERTMARVLGFLGIDESFASSDWARELHPSAAKRRPRRLLGAKGGLASVRLLRRLPDRAAAPLRPLLTRPVERPALDRSLHERLVALLRPDVARLREETGQPFEAWLAPPAAAPAT